MYFLHTNIHCDVWSMTASEHNFAFDTLPRGKNLTYKFLSSRIIGFVFTLEGPCKTNTWDISNLKIIL